MDKICENCKSIEVLSMYEGVCGLTGNYVAHYDFCQRWEPNSKTELLMLREENEKLKNENLALPHLLEYNKELEEKMQWISVTQNLPDEYRTVLVAYDNGLVYVSHLESVEVMLTNFEGTKLMWRLESGHIPLNKVTHWMPLPKLTKERG